jgi:hypothetical protein
MHLVGYLDAPVSRLLANPPFSEWVVTRSMQDGLPKKKICYEFNNHGVEVICDEMDQIRTIFLHRGDGETLSDIDLSLSRRDVLERYGSPTKSGAAGKIPLLGDHGSWDRFTLGAITLHVQYQLDRDQIETVTLISHDVVP